MRCLRRTFLPTGMIVGNSGASFSSIETHEPGERLVNVNVIANGVCPSVSMYSAGAYPVEAPLRRVPAS